MDSELKFVLRKFELGERIEAPFKFYFDLERTQR